ncbi:MAG TPA: hypothetical protein VGR78_00840 [Verrucomicrobiae bacterium]|nr:hypothetical protein [Verrucomicrobiae bacterium]
MHVAVGLFPAPSRLVRKWRSALCAPKVSGFRRKQIIVATGRQFAVDWWRIRPGRTTAESLAWPDVAIQRMFNFV